MKLPCIVCDKLLLIEKDMAMNVNVVQGGMFLNVDIDEGSRFHKPSYRREAAKVEHPSFFTKLLFSTHISSVLCDDCLEKKQRSCYGTTIEVKKEVKTVWPDGSDSATHSNDGAS